MLVEPPQSRRVETQLCFAHSSGLGSPKGPVTSPNWSFCCAKLQKEGKGWGGRTFSSDIRTCVRTVLGEDSTGRVRTAPSRLPLSQFCWRTGSVPSCPGCARDAVTLSYPLSPGPDRSAYVMSGEARRLSTPFPCDKKTEECPQARWKWRHGIQPGPHT